jgi:hypothetical protein
MSTFACKTCSQDLIVRIDLFARCILAEYPDGDYPEDELQLDGLCDNCEIEFSFSGHMFAQFVKTKIEEGIISEEAQEYKLLNIKVTEDQFEEFNRLLEVGDADQIEEFIRSLIEDI